jgi:hypothetical protein
MAKLREVCRYIRSKNAGPFWITIDLFFDSAENYGKYRDSEALGAATFASLYGADPLLVKRFAIDNLHTVKVSFARPTAQGGMIERDMHAGQQYVRLLGLDLSRGAPEV